MADVRRWQVFADGRCPPMADVRQWQVFADSRCSPMAGVRRWADVSSMADVRR